MKRRSLSIATVIGFAASTLVLPGNASAHPTVNAGPLITPPASLSTSGDYATDVLGDPWDFSEQGDVPPYLTLGAEAADAISWDRQRRTVERRRPRWHRHQTGAQLRCRAAVGSRWPAPPRRRQHVQQAVVLGELHDQPSGRHPVLDRSRLHRYRVPSHGSRRVRRLTAHTNSTSPAHQDGPARSSVSTC